MEEKIPIVIGGQTYEIMGNPMDSLYYNSLSEYIEKKMQEVADSTNVVSSQKIAILTALNIADELLREREARALEEEKNNRLYAELGKMLDENLKEWAPQEKKESAPKKMEPKKSEPSMQIQMDMDLE